MSQIDADSVRLRVEAGSVHDLISDTLRGFQAQAERAGITLTGAVPPDLPPTPFDQARIQRVLDDLVGNALRHTPARGSVTIAATATDGAITIEVRDTGEGIDPSDWERVFEPFYRGDAARSRGAGPGLGLTIARAIVQGHGGTIAIASARGQGTTVRLTLPSAGPADPHVVEAPI
ncbi:MAG: ATP-binding protein [Chloroflexi bacterium]|nr:ATP-binding protein [Chloroflexota bacterium]